ncbi:unnamed protein product [Effrenium voratum]|nr:unnamed protein product [Effrenium voratum]
MVVYEVILNVNISIVEDAYHEAKQRYMSRQRNEEPELFPDRVRRALEEESPELDTLELLYGHHVHSDAERSSAEPNFHQRLHPHAPHGSDATDTSESSGLFSRTVSGKYISPRLLESPKLQRALVSTFAETRQRAQSLPARGFTEMPADPRSSVDGSSGAEQLNVSLGTSSSSAESRGGLELCKEDNPPGPETEMQCVVVLPPDVVDALVQLQRSSQQLRSQAGSRISAFERGLPKPP